MATLRTASCPEEVLDWIAWYTEPELPSEVRGAIDRHAAECLACREELAWVQEEPGGAAERTPEAERVYAHVMARVRGRAHGSSPSDAPVALRQPARWAPARWLAAAAAAALLMGGAWLGLGAAKLGPVYETATASANPSAGGPSLDVLFRDEASWSEIRSLLERLDLRVAAGPAAGSAGRLRLALAPGADPDATLAGLRESGLTAFAEPAPR